MESASTDSRNGEQRLHALNELTKCMAGAPTALEACLRTAPILATCAPELPFTLLYVVEPGSLLRLAATSGLTPAEKAALSAERGAELWKFENATACGSLATIELDQRHYRLLPSLRAPQWACVLPIPGAACRVPSGYLVVGLRSDRMPDEGSREFLQLLASAIGSALAAFRAAEAERAHQQLIGEIERSTSTFFSYIGHELRTPLHAILGWAQVLNQDGVAAPQLARGLEAIERNARAQNEMVTNLIALRRRMSGQGRVGPSTLATVAAAAASAVPTTSDRNQPRSERELEGLSVLVVEDNVDGLDVVREVLSTAGAKVITAGSSEEGLTMLGHHKVDLIVSDLGLPGANGYAFIQQVRSQDQSAGGTTPALALSALAQSADRERALRSGFQMHLGKPVEGSELVTVCASLTGRLG
jgi:CheY-like chemotaxis protein